ncbi:hypothetical protein [Cellulomonas dongxiuzhuiae]|uniref:Uncharacterized protein n=1 Tax=Cellulomonas dongxiuzhuiae TaxID=2819979 RepID=A0ABX8GLZ8_9CELL|nr:hypothetical protein [Cellulomonas dongxiuzhuiae]MBO3095848.1 hypothetical protein [Cellulomonas dongxiuzhuiae]QWC17154.1 hypothetical protein KKR89_06010 [Cellulomonas dongxiuzhuiae]
MTTDDQPYPDHWSAAARDAVEEVLEVRGDLAGADLAALTQVADLITAADALASAARADGYTTAGSTGQTVVHPAIIEARLARTAAASILARLASPSAGTGAMTSTARARTAARARWATR